MIADDAALTSAAPAPLAAGASRRAYAFCPSTCLRPRCVFTTGAAAAAGFRASACVAATYTDTNTDKICLPAS